jgi:hypothetical protein
MDATTGFKLDPRDVTWGIVGSSSGRTRPTRRSRAETGSSSSRITLTHVATGVTVEGEVPSGRYTRGQMRTAKEQLHARLFSEIEAKVARHMRLPSKPR